MQLWIYFVSWVTLGWLASRLADKRGRNCTAWFSLGVILGVFSLVLLYFLPSKKTEMTEQTPPPSLDHPLTTKLWYYLDGDKNQYGPMSFYALQEAWSQKALKPSTYVWNDEMEDWKRVEALPDFLSLIMNNI